MAKYYKWNFCWSKMRELYIQKSKEKGEQLQSLCSFLVDLTQAAFCGGKKSDDEVGLDDGDGIDELDDSQIEQMKAMLGETDFNRLYGHLI